MNSASRPPADPPADLPADPAGEQARREAVAATAEHIRGVIGVLRALELGEAVPAPTYSAAWAAQAVRTTEPVRSGEEEQAHAAV